MILGRRSHRLSLGLRRRRSLAAIRATLPSPRRHTGESLSPCSSFAFLFRSKTCRPELEHRYGFILHCPICFQNVSFSSFRSEMRVIRFRDGSLMLQSDYMYTDHIQGRRGTEVGRGSRGSSPAGMSKRSRLESHGDEPERPGGGHRLRKGPDMSHRPSLGRCSSLLAA